LQLTIDARLTSYRTPERCELSSEWMALVGVLAVLPAIGSLVSKILSARRIN
jgi:hypothetical protein